METISKILWLFYPIGPSAKIGVELKATPFKVNKNGSISAKERLVLTITISWKSNLDDFIPLICGKCQRCYCSFISAWFPDQTMFDYVIEKVFLYEWFGWRYGSDFWRTIDVQWKIKQGKAHELSESDGNYLSTCTKGAGKGRDSNAAFQSWASC